MSAPHLVGLGQRRSICATLALLMASQAHGQVAMVAVFGPMPDPVITQDGGVRVRAESDFALRELGSWRASAGTARQAIEIGAQRFSEPQPVAFHTGSLTAACGDARFAPPRALIRRIALARQTWWPAIAAAECRFGLPSGLMDSVVLAESGYDPAVISPAGAAGLAQLMPSTARDMGVLDRFDPHASAEAGARYLRSLLDSFGGNVPLALAAYNAGPAIVRKLRAIPFNGETPLYVRRVLDFWTQPGIGPMSTAQTARQTVELLGFLPSPK